MIRRALRVAEPVLLVAVILAAWEFLPGALNVKAYLLPTFSDVLSAGWTARSSLTDFLWITSREVLLGFLLAAAGGLLLAVLIYGSAFLRRTLYPLLVALQGLPKVALAPLFVIWFGYGLGSKVLMAFLFALFPVAISTLGGLAGTPAHLEEHFRALRASRWATFAQLRVPYALPAVIDGCKVAMPLAVIGAIVGEFVGADEGLGMLIQSAASSNRTDLVFASLLLVTLLSFVLYGVIELLGRLVWWRGRAAA
ncbi:ABC transporter permease [Actinomadura sp. 3N508]|uniref:ABC transporter permease n=1 Tax=Actinomadura sp. 3N508 TaxID=3375153 RepID=UPI00379E46A9